MWKRRTPPTLTFLILGALTLGMLVLSSCGPRVGAVEATPSDNLLVSLPSLVIDLQSDGRLQIGGQPLADLAAAMGQELDIDPLDPIIVEALMNGNIQHVQLDNAPEGPLLLFNGQPIPSISWDADSLAALGATVDLFGTEPQSLHELLPLVRKLGVGATIRLPLADGAEPIPLYVTGEGSNAAKAQASQDMWLDILGDDPLRLKVGLNYAKDGTASLAGINAGWLSNLGIPLNGLNQTPALMQSVAELGIERISLSSDADGIRLAINDSPLPAIAWTDGEVTHLLRIVLQVALQESPGDLNRNVERIVAFIEEWLPAAQTTELELSVDFGG